MKINIKKLFLIGCIMQLSGSVHAAAAALLWKGTTNALAGIAIAKVGSICGNLAYKYYLGNLAPLLSHELKQSIYLQIPQEATVLRLGTTAVALAQSVEECALVTPAQQKALRKGEAVKMICYDLPIPAVYRGKALMVSLPRVWILKALWKDMLQYRNDLTRMALLKKVIGPKIQDKFNMPMEVLIDLVSTLVDASSFSVEEYEERVQALWRIFGLCPYEKDPSAVTYTSGNFEKNIYDITVPVTTLHPVEISRTQARHAKAKSISNGVALLASLGSQLGYATYQSSARLILPLTLQSPKNLIGYGKHILAIGATVGGIAVGSSLSSQDPQLLLAGNTPFAHRASMLIKSITGNTLRVACASFVSQTYKSPAIPWILGGLGL